MSGEAFEVTDDLIKEFEENGAICVRQAVSQEWVAKIAEGVAKITEDPRYNTAVNLSSSPFFALAREHWLWVDLALY